MKLVCFFGALLLFLSLATASRAQDDSAKSDTPLGRFEVRYRTAKSLAATFLEEYSENGRVTRKEAGNAFFLRPGKMRWDYEAPEKNLFLVDGKYAWFYAPADKTASRMPAKRSEDFRTPLALLTTDMKLSRICSEIAPAKNEKPDQPSNRLYRCVLRSAEQPKAARDASNLPQPEVAYFEVTPQGELARIVILEPAGIRIEFRFKNWDFNPALDKSLFQFRPPLGVAIVDGVLPESPAARQ
ncbi:MAG TPA: outer-membrane lipoprotein carrier protein LolA [Candidatus Acidoferrum sp.]